MFGLIFDCFEKWVISQYGSANWDLVIDQTNSWVASITAASGGELLARGTWDVNRNYDDAIFFYLANDVAERFDTIIETIIENTGFYFLDYVRKIHDGAYDHILQCQGHSLREWISHVNDFHTHLQGAMQGKAAFCFPEIFVVDDDEEDEIDGSALVIDHIAEGKVPNKSCFSRAVTMQVCHRSIRGNVLAPLVVGIVKNAASVYFNSDVKFQLLKKQGESGNKYTAWRVTELPRSITSSSSSKEEEEEEKGAGSAEYRGAATSNITRTTVLNGSNIRRESSSNSNPLHQCPHLRGRGANDSKAMPKEEEKEGELPAEVSSSSNRPTTAEGKEGDKGRDDKSSSNNNNNIVSPASNLSEEHVGVSIGLSGESIKAVLPFHIAVNTQLQVVQIGSCLHRMLSSGNTEERLLGMKASELFDISLPSLAKWDWNSLVHQRNGLFELHLTEEVASRKERNGYEASRSLRLYGSLLIERVGGAASSATTPRQNDEENVSSTAPAASGTHMIFLLQPNINSITEMMAHKLKWSDFGRHSSQQKLILLAENLKSETAEVFKSKQQSMLSQQSLEMKRMFVRYVSHEIRTPLNTVSVGLELLKEMMDELGDEASSPTPNLIPPGNRAAAAATAVVSEMHRVSIEFRRRLSNLEDLDGEFPSPAGSRRGTATRARDEEDEEEEEEGDEETPSGVLMQTRLAEYDSGGGGDFSMSLEELLEKQAAAVASGQPLGQQQQQQHGSSSSKSGDFIGGGRSVPSSSPPLSLATPQQTNRRQRARAERRGSLVDLVGQIKESCDIAVNILNDLLLYEKLEGGITKLECKCEPALSMILDAAKPFQIQARQAGLELQCTFDTSGFSKSELQNPTLFIDVDKPKMCQVIRNMVSNAIKFSLVTSVSRQQPFADGGVVPDSEENSRKVLVHVSVMKASDIDRDDPILFSGSNLPVARSAAGGGGGGGRGASKDIYLRVQVIDCGPGISPENQKKLFNEIIQFDPNTLQGGGGSGLGLYISKGIMDLHDGRIGVFSNGEGSGSSCFYIDLPAHRKRGPCLLHGGTVLPVSPEARRTNGRFGGNFLSGTKKLSVSFGGDPDNDIQNSLFRPSAIYVSADCTPMITPSLTRASSRKTLHTGGPTMGLSQDSASSELLLNALVKLKPKSSVMQVDLAKMSVNKLAAPFTPIPATPMAQYTDGDGGGGDHDDIMTAAAAALLNSDTYEGSRDGRFLKDRLRGAEDRASAPLPGAAAVADSSGSSVDDLPEMLTMVQEEEPLTSSKSDTDQNKEHSFPVAKDEGTKHVAVKRQSAVAKAAAGGPVAHRLLVVDDSKPTRKMVARYLRTAKLCNEIIEAEDGQQALNLITASLEKVKSGGSDLFGFDAVLMDFVMPVMDGPTSTQRMREAGYTGPIIGITGNVLPEDIELFTSKGATAVVGKPLDMAKLMAVLEEHVVHRPSPSLSESPRSIVNKQEQQSGVLQSVCSTDAVGAGDALKIAGERGGKRGGERGGKRGGERGGKRGGERGGERRGEMLGGVDGKGGGSPHTDTAMLLAAQGAQHEQGSATPSSTKGIVQKESLPSSFLLSQRQQDDVESIVSKKSTRAKTTATTAEQQQQRRSPQRQQPQQRQSKDNDDKDIGDDGFVSASKPAPMGMGMGGREGLNKLQEEEYDEKDDGDYEEVEIGTTATESKRASTTEASLTKGFLLLSSSNTVTNTPNAIIAAAAAAASMLRSSLPVSQLPVPLPGIFEEEQHEHEHEHPLDDPHQRNSNRSSGTGSTLSRLISRLSYSRRVSSTGGPPSPGHRPRRDRRNQQQAVADSPQGPSSPRLDNHGSAPSSGGSRAGSFEFVNTPSIIMEGGGSSAILAGGGSSFLLAGGGRPLSSFRGVTSERQMDMLDYTNNIHFPMSVGDHLHRAISQNWGEREGGGEMALQGAERVDDRGGGERNGNIASNPVPHHFSIAAAVISSSLRVQPLTATATATGRGGGGVADHTEDTGANEGGRVVIVRSGRNRGRGGGEGGAERGRGGGEGGAERGRGGGEGGAERVPAPSRVATTGNRVPAGGGSYDRRQVRVHTEPRQGAGAAPQRQPIRDDDNRLNRPSSTAGIFSMMTRGLRSLRSAVRSRSNLNQP